MFRSETENSPKFTEDNNNNTHSVYMQVVHVLCITGLYIHGVGMLFLICSIPCRCLAIPQFRGRKATSLTSFFFMP